MHIVFLVSEVAPFYKTGGLGDVAAALPKALVELGHHVTIIAPRHPSMTIPDQWQSVERFQVVYDRIPRLINVWQTTLPQTSVIVNFFSEPSIISGHQYSNETEADKYAVFSLAAAHWLANNPDRGIDLVHLHDWHPGLVPLILKYQYKCSLPTLLTIHNLNFQGQSPTAVLAKLDLKPPLDSSLDWDRNDGNINMLMQAIIHVDQIVTVSPTYAQEILTTPYGAHLEDILRVRQSRLKGILNGIDTDIWNPETDPALWQSYTSGNYRESKRQNKQQLSKFLNLSLPDNSMLLAYIGRLDEAQKGVDLLLQTLNQQPFLSEQCQLLLLGVGDAHLEEAIRYQATQHQYFHPYLVFDDQLAHRIYASADCMIIPSRYEPCGLVQMIAMRYGTVPVVRQTGGLADTVTDNQTGFVFPEYSASALSSKLQQAIQCYTQNDQQWQQLIQADMQQNFSWAPAARQYVELYVKCITEQ